VNAAFKKRVDVQQEHIGGDREYPGDGGEEDADGGVDDDVGYWIAMEVTCLGIHPLPEIMQFANHLCRDLLKKSIQKR